MWYVCISVFDFPSVPWFLYLICLVFPSTGLAIRFKKLCFITPFFMVELKDLESPGNGVSMKHTLIFICSKREAWSCCIPHQIVKRDFCCKLFKGKISVFIVSLVLFPLPHFHLPFPFENMTCWHKNCMVNSMNLWNLWKNASIWSYNPSLEINMVSSLPQ